MSTRARFGFSYEASSEDPKTSIVKVKKIQLFDDDETVYTFPSRLQSTTLHEELCTVPVIKAGIKSLSKRGQIRNLNVTLTDKLKKLYFDCEGNVCFQNTYLDEYMETQTSESPVPIVHEKKKNLSSLVKNMVVEKYMGKNQNVNTWLKIFEQECTRMEIDQVRYPEVMRLFLDGPAQEWFSLNLKLLEITSSWEEWKTSFISSFGDRGWSDITYAYTFRYYTGSLNEYAIRKLNLLLDADPTMSLRTRIHLIGIGLPLFIRERLHLTEIASQNKLIAELNQLESLVNKNKAKMVDTGRKQLASYSNNNHSTNNQNNYARKDTNKTYDTNNRKTMTICSICEQLGFPGRHHPEAVCRNNLKNNKVVERNIKIANNTELENKLNEETEQKNS
jgi:queuine/archaeosine tRNA-ribosyltransferase